MLCVAEVLSVLQRQPGVCRAVVDLGLKQAIVKYDAAQVTAQSLAREISTRYPAAVERED